MVILNSVLISRVKSSLSPFHTEWNRALSVSSFRFVLKPLYDSRLEDLPDLAFGIISFVV